MNRQESIQGACPSENPFRVRQTKPGVLRYLFPQHPFDCCESQNRAFANLVTQFCQAFHHPKAAKPARSSLVGPHGTGKTTLLKEIQRAVEPCYGKAIALTLSSSQARKQKKRQISKAVKALQSTALDHTWLIIDGVEQLDGLMRWSLARQLDQIKKPSLVTSHRDIPHWSMIHQTESSAPLVHALVDRIIVGQSMEFCNRVESYLSQRSINESTNLRDLWFDLYDLVGECD